jgi:hypothetical protein
MVVAAHNFLRSHIYPLDEFLKEFVLVQAQVGPTKEAA